MTSKSLKGSRGTVRLIPCRMAAATSTHYPPASACSSGTTASAPGGRGAPVLQEKDGPGTHRSLCRPAALSFFRFRRLYLRRSNKRTSRPCLAPESLSDGGLWPRVFALCDEQKPAGQRRGGKRKIFEPLKGEIVTGARQNSSASRRVNALSARRFASSREKFYADACSVAASTSSMAAANSVVPVLGTMMVFRRPWASSVMRRNLPRSFSRNST